MSTPKTSFLKKRRVLGDVQTTSPTEPDKKTTEKQNTKSSIVKPKSTMRERMMQNRRPLSPSSTPPATPPAQKSKNTVSVNPVNQEVKPKTPVKSRKRFNAPGAVSQSDTHDDMTDKTRSAPKQTRKRFQGGSSHGPSEQNNPYDTNENMSSVFDTPPMKPESLVIQTRPAERFPNIPRQLIDEEYEILGHLFTPCDGRYGMNEWPPRYGEPYKKFLKWAMCNRLVDYKGTPEEVLAVALYGGYLPNPGDPKLREGQTGLDVELSIQDTENKFMIF